MGSAATTVRWRTPCSVARARRSASGRSSPCRTSTSSTSSWAWRPRLASTLSISWARLVGTIADTDRSRAGGVAPDRGEQLVDPVAVGVPGQHRAVLHERLAVAQLGLVQAGHDLAPERGGVAGVLGQAHHRGLRGPRLEHRPGVTGRAAGAVDQDPGVVHGGHRVGVACRRAGCSPARTAAPPAPAPRRRGGARRGQSSSGRTAAASTVATAPASAGSSGPLVTTAARAGRRSPGPAAGPCTRGEAAGSSGVAAGATARQASSRSAANTADAAAVSVAGSRRRQARRSPTRGGVRRGARPRRPARRRRGRPAGRSPGPSRRPPRPAAGRRRRRATRSGVSARCFHSPSRPSRSRSETATAATTEGRATGRTGGTRQDGSSGARVRNRLISAPPPWPARTRGAAPGTRRTSWSGASPGGRSARCRSPAGTRRRGR